MWVCFNRRATRIPIRTPINNETEKVIKKRPAPSKTDENVAGWPWNFWQVSNITIEMASFNSDSPKMMVYSLGSTLYALKIERIVTGSVADNVAPTDIASANEMSILSNPKKVQIYNMIPITTADMKVPGMAKIKIDNILLKKFTWFNSYPLFKIIGGNRTLKK